MQLIRSVSFENNRGQRLRGYVHEPRRYKTAVIILHGFPGHCDGSVSLQLASALAKKKCVTLRFNFSGSDTSEGNFEDKLMSQEVKEIKSAIDLMAENYPFRQLILIGHSTGAIDAALYAHTDKRIDKVVLLGAVSKLDEAVHYDFKDRQVHDFWKKGHIVYNRLGKWVHQRKLRKTFYDEFFTLDIPTAIKKYKKPLLLVHGECDEAVPMKEAEELLEIAHKPKKLVIIRGADHSFTKPEHFLKLIKVVHWFIKE